MTRLAALATCSVALASREDRERGQTWVHVLPAGSFTGRDGRGPYRADDAAAIMAESRAFAGRRAIPVAYDHQIDLAAANGRPAPAAGWIKGLQARADGIWGLVEWTARAAQHLAAREYRYLSPAFNHTRDGRVTRILRAALTNNPNLDQLTALASMESTMDDPANDGLAELRQLLELGSDAGMPAILAAIRELKTQRMAAGAPNPAEYVPIGDFMRVTQELNRVHQGVELQTARMHVDEQISAGRLLPFLRDWAVSLCSVNKPAFDDFLKKTGGSFAHLFKPTVQGGAFRDPGRATDLSDTDAHVAAVLGHSPDAFGQARGS